MTNLNNQSLRPVLPLHYRLEHLIGRLVGRRFDYLLDGIEHGQLTFTWPDGHTSVHGTKSEHAEENAQVTLSSFNVIRQLMLNGENGFAESYMRGEWTTDNLCHLFNLIMNNENQIKGLSSGSRIKRLFNSIRHALNHNSLSGSRRNIEFHYDLGNAFYRLWLDKDMNYSSGIYRSPEHTDSENRLVNPASQTSERVQSDSVSGVVTETLEEAQQRKLSNVIKLLAPEPGARVLEIGCGWGRMARELATVSQCEVEGISLSHEQLRYATDHNTVHSENGSTGGTCFRHQDYRLVDGQYDHIVSIEMFEAVGEQYWSTYFDKVSSLLNQGGSAVLQVITIAEDRFEQYKATPDFIQRYIFPGGMLPSKQRLHDLINDAGFDLVDSEWFGQSYAKTLAEWRERFEQVTREVQSIGFDERFERMWRYYLSYCETGFKFERTDVGQLLLHKR